MESKAQKCLELFKRLSYSFAISEVFDTEDPKVNELRAVASSIPLYLFVAEKFYFPETPDGSEAVFEVVILTEETDLAYVDNLTPVIKVPGRSSSIAPLPLSIVVTENFLLKHTWPVVTLSESYTKEICSYAENLNISLLDITTREFIREILRLLFPYNLLCSLDNIDKLNDILKHKVCKILSRITQIIDASARPEANRNFNSSKNRSQEIPQFASKPEIPLGE